MKFVLVRRNDGVIWIPIMVIVLAVVAFATTAVILYLEDEKASPSNNAAHRGVTTFSECAAAGYPVMESHPRRCAADSRTFFEVLSNANAFINTDGASEGVSLNTNITVNADSVGVNANALLNIQGTINTKNDESPNDPTSALEKWNANTSANFGSQTNVNSQQKTTCTLEAKVCSDGSTVSRVPPDCAFAECPQTTNTTVPSSKACTSDADCGLLMCSGCFAETYIQDAPPDLPCRAYEGYSCACTRGRCTEVR
jgi:hypothetical protein